MKRSLAILIFALLSNVVNAQLDTARIIITTDQYFYVEQSDGPSCEEDTILSAFYTTINRVDFPVVRTPDATLDSVIIKLINSVYFADFTDMQVGTGPDYNPICMDDIPDRNSAYFDIMWKSGTMLSFVFSNEFYSGMGGHGSTQESTPITIDLINKKQIRFNDVFSEKGKAELEAEYYRQLELEYIDKSAFQTEKEFLETFPFSEKFCDHIAFDGKQVIIYQLIPYGGRSSYQPLYFPLTKFKKYLDRNFARLLKN